MRIQRIPRQLLLLTMTMVVANTASWMYRPFLPLYLESLGASVVQVGIFYTIQTLMSVMFRIIGGWISDNLGRLPTVATGSVLGWFALIGFALAPTWQWAFLGALLGQMGSSLVAPSFRAFTAEHAPEDGMSSTFGLVRGLFLTCKVIGPILGGVLIQQFSYRLMLWAAVGVFTIATAMRLWLARKTRFQKVNELEPLNIVKDLRGLLGMFTLGGIILWLFITDGMMDAVRRLETTFAPKLMTDLGGLTESEFGIVVGVAALLTALVMIPGGNFADKYGERRSIALGAVLVSVMWASIVLVPGTYVYIAAFVLAGASRALIDPAFSSLISKAVPRQSLGMVWGVFMTAFGILAIPAPYLGGLLYDYIAPEAPFMLIAVVSLLAAPLVLWKLHPPTDESSPKARSEQVTATN